MLLFHQNNIKETYRKIRSVDFKISTNVRISEEAVDLLKVMLEKDSSKRATLEELNFHPFVTNNGEICPPLEESKLSRDKVNNIIGIPGDLQGKQNLEGTLFSSIKEIESGGLTKNLEMDNKFSKVWVTKCVDYSLKYGLGYLLSNGYIGVFFNDKSKMLLSSQVNIKSV